MRSQSWPNGLGRDLLVGDTVVAELWEMDSSRVVVRTVEDDGSLCGRGVKHLSLPLTMDLLGTEVALPLPEPEALVALAQSEGAPCE